MSSTFDSLVNDCLQTLQGFGLAQSRAAFLTASATSGDLQLSVGSADGFEQGIAEVDNEVVFIESVDYASNLLTISTDGRGYYGTAAASHAAGARVTMAPVWPRLQIAQAINEAILGTYPTLFGIATTSFAYSPVQTTYELPAGTAQVLKVTTATIGPSREQVQINRYSFNAHAPTSEFPSGCSITLEQGGSPGRDITVTCMTAPVEITFGDDFAECGLSETAKLAVKYSACSGLTALMDASRLPVDTAQADEYDPSKDAIGTAARISLQLYQRYQLELENERRRQRITTPTPILKRTR